MKRLSGLRLAEGAGGEFLELDLENDRCAVGSRKEVLGGGGAMSEAGCVVAATDCSRLAVRAMMTGFTDKSLAGVADLDPVGTLAEVALVMSVNSAERPSESYEICIGRLPRA